MGRGGERRNRLPDQQSLGELKPLKPLQQRDLAERRTILRRRGQFNAQRVASRAVAGAERRRADDRRGSLAADAGENFRANQQPRQKIGEPVLRQGVEKAERARLENGVQQVARPLKLACAAASPRAKPSALCADLRLAP